MIETTHCLVCGVKFTGGYGYTCSPTCHTQHQNRIALARFYQGIPDWRYTRPSSAPPPNDTPPPVTVLSLQRKGAR